MFIDRIAFYRILKPLPVLLAAVFVFQTCAVFDAPSTGPYSNAQQLARYRTFDIAGPVRTGSADPLFTEPGLDIRIRLDIETELQSAGLTLSRTSPDLKIYYYYGLPSEAQLFPLPYRPGPSAAEFLTGSHTANRIGSRFTIDMVDNLRNELVWSGTDSLAGFRDATDPARMSRSVRSILKRFPS